MQITEVKNQQDKKEFIDFPKRLYRDDPCWVCMLDSELEGFLIRKRTIHFRHGEATRWILKDEQRKTIGRIAAFYRQCKISSLQAEDRWYRIF